MSTCAPHREFLGAFADGEMDLVPAATVEHVKGCAGCAQEIQAQQLLTRRIGEASDQIDEPASRDLTHSPRRRRTGLIAGTAAAVLLVAGAAAWSAFAKPDLVQAAVLASSGPLQIQSADASSVGAWCVEASGRSVPEIQLDEMKVVGARMDRVTSTDIVTVKYSAPDGSQVAVSWLEGQPPAGSGIEEKNVAGRIVLLVHAPRGTAVVVSSSNPAMWETAAAIETMAA